MIPNIALIDDNEDEIIPDETDLEEDEETDCWACFGTGEGHASDTTCSYCKGSGVISKTKY